MTLPKITDPSLPSVGGLGFVGEPDAAQQIAVASALYFKDADGKYVQVSLAKPVPVTLIGEVPAGSKVLGKVGVQVGGTDVAAANPVPVVPGTGVEFDVSDRSDRQLGRVTVSGSITALSGEGQEVFTVANPGVVAVRERKHKIYGAVWDRSASPILTRTHDAVGLRAGVGTDGSLPPNDFDLATIFEDWEEVEDELGNAFVRIPKIYLRKVVTPASVGWYASRHRHPGFWAPWLFRDSVTGKELPYFDYGKHLASKDGTLLASKPGRYPLIGTSIVNFRTYAKNNNTDGRSGYQQQDIHAWDLLQTLLYIELGTLDVQTAMRGWSEGQYTASHVALATEEGANRVVLTSAQAALYRVGQAISIGTSQGGNQIFYGRTITAIEPVDDGQDALVFDGEPANVAEGHIVYNSGWRTGFGRQIAASSGNLIANDGKYPCVYRGIESPYGDVWEWIDGINVTDYQSWVCTDPASYASNLFASPYVPLAYTNHTSNGYVTAMGYDPDYPWAEMPIAVGGDKEKYYADYYYQDTGQRVVAGGARWAYGRGVGPAARTATNSSSSPDVGCGGRLHRKTSL